MLLIQQLTQQTANLPFLSLFAELLTNKTLVNKCIKSVVKTLTAVLTHPSFIESLTCQTFIKYPQTPVKQCVMFCKNTKGNQTQILFLKRSKDKKQNK